MSTTDRLVVAARKAMDAIRTMGELKASNVLGGDNVEAIEAQWSDFVPQCQADAWRELHAVLVELGAI